ncbi:ribokinase [Georgenia wangjunii]|uniref:ribokinase n=1 Tax=Georgenia wangjunii TaxID=3117730 RepID=UPI002F263E03
MVLGSANMDMTVEVGELPELGETVIGRDYELRPGGKGANQAVAAAVYGGAAVSFAGSVGDDRYGPPLRDALAAVGVDVSRLRTVHGRKTGVAVVLVDRRGDNAIIVSPGANHAPTAAEVEELLPDLDSAAGLLMQMELPVPVVERATELAHAAGVPVVLNLAPATEVSDDVLRRLAVLVVNRSEAEFLLGEALPDVAHILTHIRRLKERGPAVVVVTAGADGAVFDDGHGPVHVPAHTVEARDTAGAGDAFVGVLAARLCGGDELPEAVDAATEAAAAAVQIHGAS